MIIMGKIITGAGVDWGMYMGKESVSAKRGYIVEGSHVLQKCIFFLQNTMFSVTKGVKMMYFVVKHRFNPNTSYLC